MYSNIYKKTMRLPLLNILRTKDSTPIYSEDNLYIVSFPKSGNTWIRFQIANLFFDETVDFHSIRKLIPSLNSQEDIHLARKSNQGIFCTHQCFNQKLKRVVYIVRDPRSVAVSYYYYQKKYFRIDDLVSFREFFERFIHTPMSDFGTWSENVGSWFGARRYDSRFLFLKYEDMLCDPMSALSLLNDTFKLGFDELRLQHAVQKSSFEKMRLAEKKNPLKKWDKSKNDIPFVRKGQVDEWKAYFDNATTEIIPDSMRYWMEELEYELP